MTRNVLSYFFAFLFSLAKAESISLISSNEDLKFSSFFVKPFDIALPIALGRMNNGQESITILFHSPNSKVLSFYVFNEKKTLLRSYFL